MATTGTPPLSGDRIKSYTVRKITRRLALTGKGDDPEWQQASLLTDFHLPWEAGDPHPTAFRALHDENRVYCLFTITDPDVHNTVRTNDKQEVAESSRAEIFFKADDALNPYYCLEIDPLGRVLDYQAFFHRNFNFAWSWPKEQLVITTSANTDGYTIEIAIGKTSLEELGLLRNKILQAGLYRADCTPREEQEPDFKWISWVNPSSGTPDFHIPSSFGLLHLAD